MAAASKAAKENKKVEQFKCPKEMADLVFFQASIVYTYVPKFHLSIFM